MKIMILWSYGVCLESKDEEKYEYRTEKEKDTWKAIIWVKVLNDHVSYGLNAKWGKYRRAGILMKKSDTMIDHRRKFWV